ncbi:hypothetical protein [Pseudanabaena sp. PCC 6802]|uniref:hypothetical protein n=1 Tax=Pseudanabaena sp. PCC 6802 TaxID=118173 RepID=UPI000381E022|nr:hypothetical protein [Pseudanabaena sp. PCC 6802]
MKRRDLEELRKQQRDRQQRNRKLWLRYGLLVLGIGGILFWMFLGKRLFNAALVSGDCKRISDALNSSSVWRLSDEFVQKGPLTRIRDQPIDSQRITEIANEIDAEAERMKGSLLIQDDLLRQYYPKLIDGLKFHASHIRNYLSQPPTKNYSGDNWLYSSNSPASESFYRIGARCQGISYKEFLEIGRQQANEFLKKL